MDENITKAIAAAITNLLRPLVMFLLRNGVPYQTFADIAKRVYVDLATEKFDIPGRKQSKSRISILTGLSRREVLRVKRLPGPRTILGPWIGSTGRRVSSRAGCGTAGSAMIRDNDGSSVRRGNVCFQQLGQIV